MSKGREKKWSAAKMQKRNHGYHKRSKSNNKKKSRKRMCSPVSILNDDCLAKIFMYLPLQQRVIMESVCKHWKTVLEWSWYDVKNLNDYSFIKPFELFENENALVMKYLIKRCGHYLQSLSISNYCDSKILLDIKNNCINLTNLTLVLENWKTCHFNNLFKNMSKLKILRVTWHHCHKLPNAFAKEIREVGGTLNELDIDHFFHFQMSYMEFPRRWIKTFATFKCLNILKIKNHMIDGKIMAAICDIQSLTELILFNVVIEIESFIDGSYIPTINQISKLKNLERLAITDVDGITDNFLRQLSTGCSKLRSLTINHAPNITDSGLASIASMKNLKILSVRLNDENEFKITDASVKKFKNMEVIDFYNFERVTDNAIIYILNNSPDLRELWLLGASISIESVLYAACVTRQRTNNISLTLVTDILDLPDNFIVEPKYISPFLTITNFT